MLTDKYKKYVKDSLVEKSNSPFYFDEDGNTHIRGKLRLVVNNEKLAKGILDLDLVIFNSDGDIVVQKGIANSTEITDFAYVHVNIELPGEYTTAFDLE